MKNKGENIGKMKRIKKLEVLEFICFQFAYLHLWVDIYIYQKIKEKVLQILKYILNL
jgi:hypothetical protein